MGHKSRACSFITFFFLLISCGPQHSALARPFEPLSNNPTLLYPIPAPTGLGDPEWNRAWHLDHLGVREAWKYGKGTKNKIVAIVDSGIDYTHPDLASNLAWNAAEWPVDGKDSDGNGAIDDLIGWDFVRGKSLPYDRAGHGTFLAALAVASDDNGEGAAGICPLCTVLSARFLNYEGMGDTEDAIAGIRFAIKHKPAVLNFSFSGEGFDSDLRDSINEAAAADIVVVVAASNDGENVEHSDTYPAKFNLPNMITVAATDKQGRLWDGSNWGAKSVHIGAPGEDILGPWEGKYDVGSGTSNAAAIVSGAVALIRSIRPSLTALQTKQLFQSTVKQNKHLIGKIASGGVMDVAAAAACAADEALPCLARGARAHRARN